MDDVRIGNALRVIRIRKHLRQEDVARRARIRREAVSRLERGEAGNARLETVRAVARALGARVDVTLRWQGGNLDRVIGAAHAELHEVVVQYFAGLGGWIWRPEVSFSIYGERGVIDILAWHAASRSLLIIELKTELVDPQGLAGTMDRRIRLGATIARQQGWDAATISGWVIVLESSTNRRRLQAHRRLLRGAFPEDGRRMRRWLSDPHGTVKALSFWSFARSGSVRQTSAQIRRVRRHRTVTSHDRPSVSGIRGAGSQASRVASRPPNGSHADE